MDWREITDDKEKYAAYLCSREWAEKREAVRGRAFGRCERCFINPMDACHHLSYERKYAEKLEDLQAICTPCHKFTHGKSDSDPLTESQWLLRSPTLLPIAMEGSETCSGLLCPVCRSDSIIRPVVWGVGELDVNVPLQCVNGHRLLFSICELDGIIGVAVAVHADDAGDS